MATIPSIKGSVFVAAIEAVKKLIANGKVERSETTRWLQPGDLDLLDASNISASAWYDIRVFDRLNCLVRDVAGSGSDDYMREQGRESARRLRQTYSQIDYVNRTQQAQSTDPRERFEAFGRDLRLMSSVNGSIYNFIKTSVDPDPQHPLRYLITWTNAEAASDITALRAEGFMNEMAAAHGHPDLWTWQRVGRDVVQFRMRSDL